MLFVAHMSIVKKNDEQYNDEQLPSSDLRHRGWQSSRPTGDATRQNRDVRI